MHGENAEWVNGAIGIRNNFSLDENGLTLTSVIDPNYQIKLTSMGLFLTTTAKENTVWTTGISASGINEFIPFNNEDTNVV